ncbi:hypothetical protein [Anabaena sp. UHCC 0253]|nr:hypothetical protein [Anabaena sp. UHCC 0253]
MTECSDFLAVERLRVISFFGSEASKVINWFSMLVSWLSCSVVIVNTSK